MKFPRFVENSKVPVWLSKIAPINIWAISLGLFVFCREELDEQTKRHELIHFRQWLELGFIGFAILYPLFWLIGKVKFRDGTLSYYQNPFEIEAYENDETPDYLDNRKPYNWRIYL